MDDDIRTCRLWEISENLHRAELTAQERAKLVAEWTELVGEKPGQLAQVLGGRGNKDGVSEAARQLGLERTDVRRCMKIASLSPEAQSVAVETGQDNIQTALLEAARPFLNIPTSCPIPSLPWGLSPT
ncbi:MAG: hypothetical protein RDU30_00945 [Desulfovibrionaceae bacterium]|nr:hypothetical protein [Desulfovibrionaceae bacterium]